LREKKKGIKMDDKELNAELINMNTHEKKLLQGGDLSREVFRVMQGGDLSREVFRVIGGWIYKEYFYHPDEQMPYLVNTCYVPESRYVKGELTNHY
jgi:hypothetical protein